MAVIKIAIQEEDQEPVAVTYFGDREGSELIIFLSLIIVLRGN